MNTNVEKALNGQINYELYSSYMYLSMSNYLKSINLNGFAHWMEIQSQEEAAHAIKIINFLQDREGKVIYEGIAKPRNSWENVLDIFEDTHKHEKGVTNRFNDLIDLAITEKDHAANSHLQWFITEQIEEEKTVLEILKQLRICHKSPEALFMMDRELATRVFVPPAAPAAQAQP